MPNATAPKEYFNPQKLKAGEPGVEGKEAPGLIKVLVYSNGHYEVAPNPRDEYRAEGLELQHKAGQYRAPRIVWITQAFFDNLDNWNIFE